MTYVLINITLIAGFLMLWGSATGVLITAVVWTRALEPAVDQPAPVRADKRLASRGHLANAA